MKTVAIIGAAGYVARELIGILARHPEVELTQLVSESQAGKSVADFHHDYGLPTSLTFSPELTTDPDVLFLCGGHGASVNFLQEHTIAETTVIIDLSMDFRRSTEFTYGLTDVHKGTVSKHIANPGCFATAIQLGMLPFLQVATNDWHIHAITGSSGAGQSLQATSHYTWRHDNLSAYKVFEHQHLMEIEHHLEKEKGSPLSGKLHFVPLRGPFTRGIFATLYTETTLSTEEVQELARSFYAESTFTKVTESAPDLKQVVGTNYALVFPEVIAGKLFVTVFIDNLLKGAAGQAVENMNHALGFPPETALHLKPLYV